jgi:type I restriction enzyme S subunit
MDLGFATKAGREMSKPWPMVALGKILQLQRRWLKPEPLSDYVEIGVRCFGRGVFRKPPVSGASLGDKRVLRIEPGDLVFMNVFAWEGAVAVAGPTETGTIGSHRFATYTPLEESCDPKFLQLYFQTKPGRELLGRVSPGSAGRNRTMNLAAFAAQEIPLPPLAEQRRIVARIEELAGKIENVQNLGEQSRRQTESLPTALAHRDDLAVAEKKALGWREVVASEIMSENRHLEVVDPTSTYPNLGIYSFGRGCFIKPDIEGALTSARVLNRVHLGQFIYSRLFAFEGACGLVTPEFDNRFVSNEYPTFECKEGLSAPGFLYAYFKASQVWKSIAAGSKGLGDRRQRVQPSTLLQHRLWLPPMKDQNEISALLEQSDSPFQRVKGNQSLTAAELDALLPSVLDKAFSSGQF